MDYKRASGLQSWNMKILRAKRHSYEEFDVMQGKERNNPDAQTWKKTFEPKIDADSVPTIQNGEFGQSICK